MTAFFPLSPSGKPSSAPFFVQLWRDLRSYYRGCRDRDLREFYDLESRLPYFDYVSRILGAHKRHLLLRWICQKPAHRPVLELGSGIGTFARQLGQRGYRVAAVDISVTKTVKARRLTAKRARGRRPMVLHFVGDLRHLGTDSDLDLEIQRAYHWSALPPFDVLLAADVLEHVPDPPGQTLRHIHRLLAPDGCFFTSVPARLCINDPGHFWTLLPEEWEPVFHDSGFHIAHRQMSRLYWCGLPTLLPLAMVYELHPLAAASQPCPMANSATASWPCQVPGEGAADAHRSGPGAGGSRADTVPENGVATSLWRAPDAP